MSNNLCPLTVSTADEFLISISCIMVKVDIFVFFIIWAY